MTQRVVFMGTPEFAVPSLAVLVGHGYDVAGVVTRPDRPAGRGRKLAPSPAKRFAETEGMSIFQPASLRSPESVEAVARMRPDVIVVAAFGLMLPQSVLDLPRQGALNVHSSLLPKYRGAAPIPAAIIAGDRETGVSVMLMDAGMDTGPVLSQAACRIEPADTTGTLTSKLGELGASLLSQTLPRWLAGDLEPRPQEEQQASYAPMIRKADGRINWGLPAAHIARLMRAYQPWPGTTTSFHGKPLKLLKAMPMEARSGHEDPGRVVAWDGGAAVVTGDGLLQLVEVQAAGRRALQIREFLNGHRHFVGSVLGERIAG